MKWKFKLKDLKNVSPIPDRTKTEIFRATGLSWQTIINLTNNPQGKTETTVPTFLIDGLGITPARLAEMKIGDVFDIVKE